MDDIELIQLLSPQLDKFEWIEFGKKTSFRCPYCGDSKKYPNKKRGGLVLFEGSFVFHCFNCSRSTSLVNLTKHVDYSLYKNYRMSSLKNSTSENFNMPKEMKKSTEEKLSLFSDLQTVITLDKTHPSVKYLNDRKIPFNRRLDIFWVDDFNAFAKKYSKTISSDRKEGALVFPWITSDGIEFGFQGRYISENPFIRYKSVAIDKRFRKCFGQQLLDTSKDINITEGVFDSLFLANSIASLDSDLSSCADQLDFDKDKFILWFDFEPHNKEIVKMKNKAIDKGYRVAFFDKELKNYGKDINEMMLTRYSVETAEKIRNSDVYSGAKAKLLMLAEQQY